MPNIQKIFLQSDITKKIKKKSNLSKDKKRPRNILRYMQLG